ncbi:MAG: Tol-Pal system protein TolB [Campylobacter sp.]|nr:Tol-Pal system protein TolB [Campylobacter sp.]
MKKLLLIMFAFVFVFAKPTEIVNEGANALPKIVIQDATNSSDISLKTKVFKLIVGDLKVGAVFDVQNSYSTSSYDGDLTTNIDSSVAYIFRYELVDGTNLRAKVLNASNGKAVFETTASEENTKRFPFLVHDIVSKALKEVAYVNVDWMKEPILFSRYTSAAQSQIIVADYTLSYQQILLSNGLNIFPKWASSAKNEFYYTYYENKTPTLRKFNISSGRSTKIMNGQGMLVASDVSSDGSKILITNAPNDQADIYMYNLRTKTSTKVTSFGGIDVSGNFIDDEKRVAFVSDRLGYPNIFAVNADGSGGVTQLVYHGRNNNSISTFRDSIVYSSRESGSREFNIYIMSSSTNFVRQLTSGGKNSFPRFSSDGGTVLFIREGAVGSAVGIIRINENKSFHFPLNLGKIQSLDW